jgi:hypothetical protein
VFSLSLVVSSNRTDTQLCLSLRTAIERRTPRSDFEAENDAKVGHICITNTCTKVVKESSTIPPRVDADSMYVVRASCVCAAQCLFAIISGSVRVLGLARDRKRQRERERETAAGFVPLRRRPS